jgi:hypothetical protein
VIPLLLPAAVALPLLSERFDAPGLPAGWKAGVGAQIGGGAASAYTFADGAVVMTAAPHTKRFTTISKKMELRDVSWLQVDARSKSAGIDADAGNDGAVCGVFVRFEGGPIQGLRPCVPNPDWTPSTRVFAVPKGARDVEVGLFLSVPGTATIDDLVVEPVDPGWKTASRGHFVYHWLDRDGFSEAQLAGNDDRYDALVAFFGIKPPPTLEYFRYDDVDALERYTGRHVDAMVDGNTIHTLRRAESHEMVAILSRTWGDPPPMFTEGLAIHLAGEWDGREAKAVARGLVGRGEAPALATLLDTAAFRGLPEATAYPLAGAFLDWIVATQDAARVKALYGQLHAGASVADNQKALEAALGKSTADLDAAFRSWL